MKNDNCPVCHGRVKKILYRMCNISNEFLVVSCSNCSHIYTFFTKDINVESLYHDEVYEVVDNRGSIFDKIIGMEYLHVISKIKNKYKKSKNILDFGCGKGKFLSVAKKEGFNIMGIETEINRSNFARGIYNINVDSNYYSSGKINTSPFQVITLFHVLEHLPNPKEIISNLVKDNLDNDGLFIIEVPNFLSFQSKLAKEKWMHIDVPRHLSHFTIKNLENFMEDISLKITETEYFSRHLGIIGMLHAIMVRFGYKKNIIIELKRKNLGTIIRVLFLLPFATVLELTACLFKQGGIIRIYAKREIKNK